MEEPSSRQSGGRTAGLGGALIGMVTSLGRGARNFAELAGESARLAAMSAISMLTMAIVAAALLIVAWVLVVAVIAYALVQAGVPWFAAGLGLAVAHLIVVYVLYRLALRLSRDLTLPALRQAFNPNDTNKAGKAMRKR